jgi:hypothetical protein
MPEKHLSQSGKQWKPVQVSSFSQIRPLAVSAKIACWGKHPQSPLKPSAMVAAKDLYDSGINSFLDLLNISCNFF